MCAQRLNAVFEHVKLGDVCMSLSHKEEVFGGKTLFRMVKFTIKHASLVGLTLVVLSTIWLVINTLIFVRGHSWDYNNPYWEVLFATNYGYLCTPLTVISVVALTIGVILLEVDRRKSAISVGNEHGRRV
jgi:hypothetical protein